MLIFALKNDHIKKADKLALTYDFDLNNNSKHNIIVRRQGERQGIVQQHINGVGNIYAPEIIIYK